MFVVDKRDDLFRNPFTSLPPGSRGPAPIGKFMFEFSGKLNI